MGFVFFMEILPRPVRKYVMSLILLDTRGRILGIPTIYKGSLNTCVIRIGKLFRSAIEQQAAAIIVAINHPSSDPKPANEDVAVTHPGE